MKRKIACTLTVEDYGVSDKVSDIAAFEKVDCYAFFNIAFGGHNFK